MITAQTNPSINRMSLNNVVIVEAIPDKKARGLFHITGAFHNPLGSFDRSPWYEKLEPITVEDPKLSGTEKIALKSQGLGQEE